MSKPTKFDLMRANRDLAEWRIRGRAPDTEAIGYGLTGECAAVVPTMKIDGVKYREAPGLGADDWHSCAGCAFEAAPDMVCDSASDAGYAGFGASCGSRGVIYIKA
jgi:hypothetical protein